NFRDLNAAVVRMATLAPGGRISVEVVEEEVERLRVTWHSMGEGNGAGSEGALERLLAPEALRQMDLFDQLQLACVIKVCRDSQTLSEAGRKLFSSSRHRKKTTNDADRLRKYLARFRLEWRNVHC